MSEQEKEDALGEVIYAPSDVYKCAKKLLITYGFRKQGLDILWRLLELPKHLVFSHLISLKIFTPQQVGGAYFKIARKCSMFGIYDERSGIQTNYLIDKSSIGKGSNAIVSLVDFHMKREM